MALLPWRTGKVISIIDETLITRRFRVEVTEKNSFDFIPGQFVTLDLPIDSKPNKRLRSYSIASWPDGTNSFELLIVLDKKGAGTKYIFNEVKVGSTFIYRGPQGQFRLHQPVEKVLFMICTGTGIAPFRSMLHYMKLNHIPHKTIFLLFGCRTKDDLLYYEEMRELEQTLADFHYLPVLSRQPWERKTGYVHQIYEDLCRDRQPSEFYLCGWSGMIDEAEKRIMDLGYDTKNIHKELYG